MMCDHCGTNNLDEALHCSRCGARLTDVAQRLEAARRRRIKRYETGAPRIPARLRARSSVVLSALGAYAVLMTLSLQASIFVFLLAGVLGLSGLALGLSVLRELHEAEGVSWSRGMALAGTLVSAAVLAAPLILIAVVMAMFPGRLAREPLAISSIRHLSVALRTYAEDNDNRLPGWVTDASGRSYHNVWDQQLSPYLSGDNSYLSSAEGRGIRSPSQPSPRTRLINFGLNGLMITRPKTVPDGNADWASGPFPIPTDTLHEPARTIVLAELATRESMGSAYELGADQAGRRRADDSPQWLEGLAQWVDVDPRAWVETSGPVKSYERSDWNPYKGVGRALHSSGAVYAFADGSVGYMKLRKTVTGGRSGMPVEEHWNPTNNGNMWYPR